MVNYTGLCLPMAKLTPTNATNASALVGSNGVANFAVTLALQVLTATLDSSSSGGDSDGGDDSGGADTGGRGPGFFIGLAIAIGSSLMQSLGMNLQRRFHLVNEKLPKEQRLHVCRSPMWHIGFYFYVFSQVFGSTIALSFLSTIILAPLGSATLVFNAIFSWLLVGDRFGIIDAVGTLIITGAAVIIAIFGYTPESSYSLNQLVALYTRGAFIGYMIAVGILSALVFLLVQHLEWNMQNYDKRSIWLRRTRKEIIIIMAGILYSVIAGVLASMSLLLAKSGVELILSSLSGDNQFRYPGTWIIVLLLIVASVAQVVYLNKGLKICSSVLIVPLFFCIFNVMSFANGLIYFNQFSCFGTLEIAMLILGVVLLIAGVAILARPQGNKNENAASAAAAAANVGGLSPPASNVPGSHARETDSEPPLLMDIAPLAVADEDDENFVLHNSVLNSKNIMSHGLREVKDSLLELIDPNSVEVQYAPGIYDQDISSVDAANWDSDLLNAPLQLEAAIPMSTLPSSAYNVTASSASASSSSASASRSGAGSRSGAAVIHTTNISEGKRRTTASSSSSSSRAGTRSAALSPVDIADLPDARLTNPFGSEDDGLISVDDGSDGIGLVGVEPDGADGARKEVYVHTFNGEDADD